MGQQNTKLSAKDLLKQGPVVPVLVVNKLEHAVPLANALVKGGVRVLEVTLRTECALDVIREIATNVPDAIVGAGTVTTPEQLKAVEEAGAQFALSPGSTTELLEAGKSSPIALIPGISSTSELMKGIDNGYEAFKFFPAEASGGVKSIKSIGGPFPNVRFCPTGGINTGNFKDYLACGNVDCIGGSWLAPDSLVDAEKWDEITAICTETLSLVD